MKSELSKIGFLGSTKCSHEATPLAAHFELHIEQGPILGGQWQEGRHRSGRSGVQVVRYQHSGQRVSYWLYAFWYAVGCVLCASRIIVESNRIAKEHKGLASTVSTILPPWQSYKKLTWTS